MPFHIATKESATRRATGRGRRTRLPPTAPRPARRRRDLRRPVRSARIVTRSIARALPARPALVTNPTVEAPWPSCFRYAPIVTPVAAEATARRVATAYRRRRSDIAYVVLSERGGGVGPGSAGVSDARLCARVGGNAERRTK